MSEGISDETYRRARESYYASDAYKESQRRYELQRQWQEESRETGKVCAKCGIEFGYQAEGYRVSEYGGKFVLMCEGCAPEWLSSGQGKPMRIIPAVKVHVWDCAACGREVVFGMSERQYRERVYCSEKCRKDFRKQASPSKRREITCEVCGKEFVSKRSDAKTCSPACRQRAYRKRLQV